MPPSTENWKRFIKGHMYGFVSYYSPELHMQTNSICLVSFTVKCQTGYPSKFWSWNSRTFLFLQLQHNINRLHSENFNKSDIDSV